VTEPIQLNANLPVNGNVTDFQTSPDNQNAVYIADQNSDEVSELFSVRMDGSTAPIKLSVASPVTGGDVLKIIGFSADGQRVIYSADQGTDGMDELLSANLDGSSRITLTPNFGAGNSFRSLALTPDRSRMIYVAVTSGAGPSRHMHSVPVGGGTIVRLSDNFALNASLTASDPDFSRDSSKVIYRVTTGGLEQQHIANTDGSGTALRLDADGSGLDRVFSYEIANDNSRVVY
jgi:Tol biopolymer transport system component